MTEADLKRLLSLRHVDDLFVAGCKNGSTTRARPGELRIMDAWVLLSTWSPPTCAGYEIKVWRGDWLRDTKWATYLPLCHQFSLVTPKGLIKPDELPAEIGLIEAIGKGSGARLVTRRKAHRRDITWPVDLMIYVLMSRVHVRAEGTVSTREARGASWRTWLASEKGLLDVGRMVSSKVSKLYREAVNEKNAAICNAERYEGVRAAMREMGMDPDHGHRWSITRAARGEDVERRIEQLTDQVRGAADGLQRLREKLAADRTLATAGGAA